MRAMESDNSSATAKMMNNIDAPIGQENQKQSPNMPSTPSVSTYDSSQEDSVRASSSEVDFPGRNSTKYGELCVGYGGNVNEVWPGSYPQGLPALEKDKQTRSFASKLLAPTTMYVI